MSDIIEIRVPDIGDFYDVPVVEIMVCVGDRVEAEDSLLAIESDKATLDVPTPLAGEIIELLVSEGDPVSKGSVIARLRPSGGAITEVSGQDEPQVPAAANAPMLEASIPPQATTTSAMPGPNLIKPPAHASPSVRKYARELGVDLATVTGTGKKDRITRDDVAGFVKGVMQAPRPTPIGSQSPDWGLPPWPKVDFEKFGPVTRRKLSRITRISGPSLARNSIIIPHVTNFDTADITDLERFRKTINAENKDGAKMSILAFVVKAVVAALKQYPSFNSSLDGDELILKDYYHIGVAADTPDGLVVPVVRDADTKGVVEIAAEMSELASNARTGKLKPADMQGGTFTISSLGGIGGTNFTPIINAPEVAILGMTRAAIQPVWDGEAFQPRLIQPLSLSWDHRVVDGVSAAKFLKTVQSVLTDFRRYSL